MLAHLSLLAVGAVLLYLGAEGLVRGASRLAAQLGVAPLVVGLTVVAYGTSAPELVVSMTASLAGRSAIALGNAVGSNIANIGLILGTTALVAPPASNGLQRRDLVVMLIGTAAVPLLLLDGTLSRFEGGLLLLGAILFSAMTIRTSRLRSCESPPKAGSAPGPARGLLPLLGLVVVGLVGLVVGGHLLLKGAVAMARDLGMSERVIGLTIVAVGTSLPELAASLVAAFKGEADIALGNVVGSNIFNVLLVLGAAACVHPIHADVRKLVLDLGVMLVLTLTCVWSLRRSRGLSRWEGLLYVGTYGGFLITLLRSA